MSSAQVLDNPIWESLNSRHRPFALGDGDVLRYPAEVAPFLGIRSETATAGALEALVPQQDSVFLLGPAPRVPAGWQLDAPVQLAQMVCPARVVDVDGPDIIELSAEHQSDVLALTALVYPHYFRPQTTALGRYFGIYQDGRLAAMIGERMGTDAWQEISAVCTHPDFTGRGLARRLLAWLSNDTFDRGRTPFLHVSQQNLRALQLYEQNGYHVRREIPFRALRREAAAKSVP